MTARTARRPVAIREVEAIRYVTPSRVATAALVAMALFVGFALVYLISSAQWQRQIVVEGGIKRGFFLQTAAEMQEALRNRGLDVVMVERLDSATIIADVNDPELPINIGFIVQPIDAREYPNVESLGSIATAPLLIFARKEGVPERPTVRDLAGLRVQIGSAGSSSNVVARDILDQYGLGEGAVILQQDQLDIAIEKLYRGAADAVILILPLTNATVQELGSSSQLVPVTLPEAKALVSSLGYGTVFDVERGMFDLAGPSPQRPVQTPRRSTRVASRGSSYSFLLVSPSCWWSRPSSSVCSSFS